MALSRRRAPRVLVLLFLSAFFLALAFPCRAADSTATAATTAAAKPPVGIRKAPAAIVLDGDLGDAGWQGIDPVTTWFETNVGDNVEPPVKNLAWLAYDDENFYAAFQFDDPNPNGIRAPLGDHDAVNSSTDYGGIIVDSRNDGKSAQMFLANPRGVQYDALTNDATGEDSAPDFFWDAVGRKTDRGWNLEIRVPFSSLRYGDTEAPTWGILLYRNYPRDRRYQFFSSRLPRDSNCFICNSAKLVGLANLPQGSHLTVAPFATARRSSDARVLGAPLDSSLTDTEFGLDLKWNPSANAAIDATLNPDFSQVESDAAQIVANERFALFFPEKRPFFLEGVDLLSTPFNAVYTRTINEPHVGLRATGRFGRTAYTVLGVHDDGRGVTIIPGAQGSDLGFQDFESEIGIVRLRHDLGPSMVSLLGTFREIDGGAHNRVFGPDFQWRPRPTDAITGQVLWSHSRTPDRPDLEVAEWDGRTLQDRAMTLSWQHGTRREDWFIQGLDVGGEFRADNGFIPQVGYREVFFEGGYTIRPKDHFFNRVRFWTVDYLDAEPDGDPLNRRVSVGVGSNAKLNSFIRFEANRDDIRVGDTMLSRFRPRLRVESSPGSVINFLFADAQVGDEIDFANGREGSGVTLSGGLSLRPNEHLEVRTDVSRRWLDLDGETASGRLFTASVGRVRGTWSFDSRSFLRLIAQHVETDRDPALYLSAVDPHDADFTLTGLFAFKLNWQTVFYAGYGDQRVYLADSDQLEKSRRVAFAKVSYAWQR